MPAYKIASGRPDNTPLLRARGGDRQADDPVDRRRRRWTTCGARYDAVAEINPQVALLQCTAGYPAAWEELDLRVIETYRELFPEAVVGLSSHDNGIAMAVAAYVLGARIVEKHFTLNRALKGTDHALLARAAGPAQDGARPAPPAPRARRRDEARCTRARPSRSMKMAKKLVAARDLPAGHMLDRRRRRAQVAGRRPAAVRARPTRSGRTLRHPVRQDTALTFELLEELLPARRPRSSASRDDADAARRARRGSHGRLGQARAGLDRARSRDAGAAWSASTSDGRRPTPSRRAARRDRPRRARGGARAQRLRHAATCSSTTRASTSRPTPPRPARDRGRPARGLPRDARRQPRRRLPRDQVFGAAMVAGRARLDREHRLALRVGGARPALLRPPARDPPFLKPPAYGASKAGVRAA